MPDPFESQNPGLQSPANVFEQVVPDDDNDLPNRPRGVYVGTGGDINATDVNGNAVVFKNVPDGSLLPIRPVRIAASLTTASDMIALY